MTSERTSALPHAANPPSAAQGNWDLAMRGSRHVRRTPMQELRRPERTGIRSGERLVVLALLGLFQWACDAGEAFSEPKEEDVVRSLLASPWLPEIDFTLMSLVSDCETRGVNKTGLSADLFGAFLTANEKDRLPLDMTQFAVRDGVSIAESDLWPPGVRTKTGGPVITVARAGLLGDEAVLCVRLYAVEPIAYFLTLERVEDLKWVLARQYVAWEPDRSFEPEEFADYPL